MIKNIPPLKKIHMEIKDDMNNDSLSVICTKSNIHLFKSSVIQKPKSPKKEIKNNY